MENNNTLADRIWDAAEDDGVIQAWDMVALFPGQPEMHTTTRIETLLTAEEIEERV